MSDQRLIWIILLFFNSDCEGLGQGKEKESVSDTSPSTLPACSYFWHKDPQFHVRPVHPVPGCAKTPETPVRDLGLACKAHCQGPRQRLVLLEHEEAI